MPRVETTAKNPRFAVCLLFLLWKTLFRVTEQNKLSLKWLQRNPQFSKIFVDFEQAPMLYIWRREEMPPSAVAGLKWVRLTRTEFITQELIMPLFRGAITSIRNYFPCQRRINKQNKNRTRGVIDATWLIPSKLIPSGFGPPPRARVRPGVESGVGRPVLTFGPGPGRERYRAVQRRRAALLPGPSFLRSHACEWTSPDYRHCGEKGVGERVEFQIPGPTEFGEGRRGEGIPSAPPRR